MNVKVNGQDVDVTLENEKTIGDFLKAFEMEVAKVESTTIGIKLNGEEINQDNFDTILEQPLKDNTLIELSVMSKNDILDSFATDKKNIDAIINKLSSLPILLQEGKDSEVNTIIHDMADEIDTFCHNATLSTLFPELYKQIKIDNRDIADFFEEFAPILTDFENALESKDSVTIGDLAEYEISPRFGKISESISAIIK